MIGYIGSRVFLALPTLVFVVVLNFMLTHLAPGDPAYALAGENATPEYLETIRQEYQLDRPLMAQLSAYLGKIATGDLGFSFSYRQPVLGLILDKVPSTLTLVVAGLILGTVLGTLAGVLAAKRYQTALDATLNVLALLLFSLPIFWLGLLMILVFAIWMGGLPAGGMTSLPPKQGLAYLGDLAIHMVLPTLTVALHTIPTYFRLTRSSVIDALQEDYVVTARAIGLRERTVLFRHCLRNALLPNITVAGMMLGSVFSGALLTEAIFSWPGIGSLMYGAVIQRDLPLVMGIFTVSAICVVIAILLTDITYSLVDPRVRHG
ncbi:ABC transporter permease [Microvirga alba]|uniref:ABC transporter permease n=1 Tax=Microvirga alba TaxID=2791025 RepID=A0A931BRN6_9HYPH|nr:ABC transporter permease [Microvirga alba]MBF9235676.1 ABC transporter permease [Microvirga alba]